MLTSLSPGVVNVSIEPAVASTPQQLGTAAGFSIPKEFEYLTDQGSRTLAHLCKLWGDKNHGAQVDDLWVASAYMTNGVPHFSKWHDFREVMNLTYDSQKLLNRANNRSILRTEVVIDIDHPTKEECFDWFNHVTAQLEMRQINFLGYETGSKGYHIHIFIPKLRTYKHTDKYKEVFLALNGVRADKAKSARKVMIALENTPHWKTGRMKKLVRSRGDGINQNIPLVH